MPGMVISQVADSAPQRIRRLIYVNAFVPLNGQCLNDMVPPRVIGGAGYDVGQRDAHIHGVIEQIAL